MEQFWGAISRPQVHLRGALRSPAVALLLSGFLLGACSEADYGAASRDAATQACLEDLRASFGLVERNYAGYTEKVARIGADTVARAQEQALHDVQENGADQCRGILNDWLAVFQEHHLGVEDAAEAEPQGAAQVASADSRPSLDPQLEILSPAAVWIRAPSFESRYRGALEELVREHADEIAERTDLIIDLRGNGGGSTTTAERLAELVYSRPVWSPGKEVLATPENIAAWERLLPEVGAQDREMYQGLLAHMREHAGGWVTIFADSETTHDRVLQKPERVAVIVDGRCASSCEQFVLEARGSSKVRVFGRTTQGSLDYAEVRAHPLPSGRTLWIGTARSRRLPEHPIDGIGIAPDVEIDTVALDGPGRSEALRRVVQQLETPRS